MTPENSDSAVAQLQVVKLRHTLFVTRLIGGLLILITWSQMYYFEWRHHETRNEFSRVVVTNSLGETAELTGNELIFRSSVGKPTVWLHTASRPWLTMGLGDGAPSATLGVETLTPTTPFGYLWLHSVGSSKDIRLTADTSEPRP